MAENTGEAKLNALSYIAYGGGNLAANLLITTASNFITYFYTESVGISMVVAGIILAACRVFDGLTDLFMGAVIDKTRSKYGKARPWLLRMAVPYLIACIALFSSPRTGGTADVVYAVISYILAVCVIYTAISVPYNTMSARMTKNQAQRTLLSTFRTLFGFGGAAMVGSITLKVVRALGDGSRGWTLMGLVYGICGMLLYLFTFKVCKELPDDFTLPSEQAAMDAQQKAAQQAAAKKSSIGKELKALFHNKYWLLIMGMTLISFISSGLSGANAFYTQYVMENTDYMALVSMCSFLPMAIGSLFVAPFVAKLGARNVCLTGVGVSIVGMIIMLFGPTTPAVLAVGLVIRGLGLSFIAVCSFAMMGDTVEYSEWKFGVRPDGLTYSAVTFGEKVGSALGTVIVSGVMAATGYVQQQATQSATAIFGIKALFLYIPLLLGAIQLVFLLFYDLDKKYDTIVADLNARKDKENNND